MKQRDEADDEDELRCCLALAHLGMLFLSNEKRAELNDEFEYACLTDYGWLSAVVLTPWPSQRTRGH